MATLSIRLSKELEDQLANEARRSHQRRSELVRQALDEYIQRKEQQRFMDQIVREMREWQNDPQSADERQALVEEAPADDLDAIIKTERAAEVDEQGPWWK